MKPLHHELKQICSAGSVGNIKNFNSFCLWDEYHPEAFFCAPFFIPRNNMKIVNTVRAQFKFLDIPQILLWAMQRGFGTCHNTNTKTNFHAIVTNII
jgi:hypothetical protein